MDELATAAEIEELLQLSNKIAIALTDSGIPPSSMTNFGLIILAAANAQFVRRVPMTRESFLRMAGALWDVVAECEWGRFPLRTEPKS